jgi:hypothetical protein
MIAIHTVAALRAVEVSQPAATRRSTASPAATCSKELLDA